ncbi:MAG: hypothetical protein WCO35_01300 [Candidatus Nomurabacteria bacterium]
MKKLVLLFVISISIFTLSTVFAQNQTKDSSAEWHKMPPTYKQWEDSQVVKDSLKLTSVELCSGKGAVASGLYGWTTFENKKSSLMLTLSAEDLEVTYLKKISKTFSTGLNVGYWINVPYISGQITWSPTKYFGTFHWVGYGFGDPGGSISGPRFFFSVQQATVTLNKNLSGNYTLIHYLNNIPTHVGNIKYTGKVNKDFSVYTNVGWDFTKQSQLLQLGLVYKPFK